VFADILLADEINRATPRTQSALFEAMAERTVTIDGHTYELPGSFFVIATQNPVDSHGAYPLPEAQLDRFAMKLSIGYPDRASEARMLADAVQARSADRSNIDAILDLRQLAHIQQHVAQIEVDAKVRNYLIDLATATRNRPSITLGLSPRGLLIWQALAQAEAFLQGRTFVTPDDVQRMAKPVLLVRLAADSADLSELIDEVVDQVKVPV
jgi:MoxR-like ATPase